MGRREVALLTGEGTGEGGRIEHHAAWRSGIRQRASVRSRQRRKCAGDKSELHRKGQSRLGGGGPATSRASGEEPLSRPPGRPRLLPWEPDEVRTEGEG